jgi:DNA-binding beta-propeller fold protein YncE
MSLRPLGYIDLPVHVKEGGFDHAAVHHPSGRLYVAHTSNDSLDVVETASDRFLRSIPGLKGVAGVLVSDERGLVFTANRAENTICIFATAREEELVRIPVGIRPNGLAFAPSRGLLLVANVGETQVRDSSTVSLVDVGQKAVIRTVVLPGRPRWTVYDELGATFYVNIADPPLIVGLDAKNLAGITDVFEIPAKGPHGLDLDPNGRQLFCACDEGKLVVVHLDSGDVRSVGDLSGAPDVVSSNAELSRVYVAVGAHGIIDVFDSNQMKLLEHTSTERGTHTIAINRQKNKVYAFLPATHRAAVYQDE